MPKQTQEEFWFERKIIYFLLRSYVCFYLAQEILALRMKQELKSTVFGKKPIKRLILLFDVGNLPEQELKSARFSLVEYSWEGVSLFLKFGVLKDNRVKITNQLLFSSQKLSS